MRSDHCDPLYIVLLARDVVTTGVALFTLSRTLLTTGAAAYHVSSGRCDHWGRSILRI